jgi:hypothetical protein
MSQENSTRPEETRAGCDACFCGGAGPAFSEFVRKLGPPEGAKRHFDAARVEFLKGLRALIDARIESLSRSETKGATVPVE